MRLRAVALAAAAIMTVALGVVATGPAASAASSGWLHTSGSGILTETGATYTIRAVSWFGMETDNCAPHGLWSISMEQALDQIAAFGLDTIRLPFANECLGRSATSSINGAVNPTLLIIVEGVGQDIDGSWFADPTYPANLPAVWDRN